MCNNINKEKIYWIDDDGNFHPFILGDNISHFKCIVVKSLMTLNEIKLLYGDKYKIKFNYSLDK